MNKPTGTRVRFSITGLKGVLLSLLVSAPGFAQLDRGTINGLITDQSGAIVPGAVIRVIGIDTNSALDLVSNSEGLYTAPNLPGANYRVVVQKEGFGTVTREPIEVRPRVDVRVVWPIAIAAAPMVVVTGRPATEM